MRHKLCKARFPHGIGGMRGPERTRRGCAPHLAGAGGGCNDGVLPPAGRCGAAAPLKGFRSSAASPPDLAGLSRRPAVPTGVGRSPRVSPQRTGAARLLRPGASRRRFRMSLTLMGAPRRGLPCWATGTSEAASSLAISRFSCLSRRCAVVVLRRAARTPQSQTGEM